MGSGWEKVKGCDKGFVLVQYNNSNFDYKYYRNLFQSKLSKRFGIQIKDHKLET